MRRTAVFLMSILAAVGNARAAGFDSKLAELDALLAVHVHEGRVDYAGLKADRAGLDSWLAAAGAVREDEFVRRPRADRLALLINVYNATTLRLIVEHYPVASIRKIGAFWDPKAPWHLSVVHLFGKTMTLDDLEQGIIRPQYKEPRVHFALVCAAKGCPPLRSQLYVGPRLDAQLDDQARTFLSQTVKNRVDAPAKSATLSPIFKWYIADFGGSKKSVLAFVKKWLPVQDDWDVNWSDYDWSLNENKK